MESFLIVPRESNMLILFLYGSVPNIKGSKILLLWFEASPVVGSIFTKLIPEGTLKGILFLFWNRNTYYELFELEKLLVSTPYIIIRAYVIYNFIKYYWFIPRTIYKIAAYIF